MKLIIITGYSGAGKSVALKVFEDSGIASMDNIPMDVVHAIADSTAARLEQLAVCSDVRAPDFTSDGFLHSYEALQRNYNCNLLFLYCQQEQLIARYNATKHRHPLYHGNAIEQSLAEEAELLHPIRMAADHVIDTSNETPHSLKNRLLDTLGMCDQKIRVMFQSFSYKIGVPRHADLVFDVRFLRNPHYIPELRAQTGRDDEVADYIQQDPNYAPFTHHLTHMLDMLVPLYIKEGKSYLTIAVGCTGGKHRSVYMAEYLAKHFSQHDIITAITHRELHINDFV